MIFSDRIVAGLEKKSKSQVHRMGGLFIVALKYSIVVLPVLLPNCA
eukprot:COSAG02_NODE_63210_length_263_cov_9.847561_1_plen_45_part_10